MGDVRIIRVGRAVEIDAGFDSPFRITGHGVAVSVSDFLHIPVAEHDDHYDMLLDGIPHTQYDHWEALTGYTGQQSYNGPVMHPSEYLGGRLARDIAETPGVYVVTTVETAVNSDTDEADWGEPAGWCVLRLRD